MCNWNQELLTAQRAPCSLQCRFPYELHGLARWCPVVLVMVRSRCGVLPYSLPKCRPSLLRRASCSFAIASRRGPKRMAAPAKTAGAGKSRARLQKVLLDLAKSTSLCSARHEAACRLGSRCGLIAGRNAGNSVCNRAKPRPEATLAHPH